LVDRSQKPLAVELSVVMTTMSWVHPISASVAMMGQPSCPLKKVAAISASAAELTTFLSMFERTRTASLRGGAGLSGSVTELVQ
jgi:hypothetical protein